MAWYVDILAESSRGFLDFIGVPGNSLRFFLMLHDISKMLEQIRKYNIQQRRKGALEIDLVLEPDPCLGTSEAQLSRFTTLLQPHQTLASFYQLVVNLFEEMKRREVQEQESKGSMVN